MEHLRRAEAPVTMVDFVNLAVGATAPDATALQQLNHGLAGEG
jgi:hypothetical protein